jgi:hypothetical protein
MATESETRLIDVQAVDTDPVRPPAAEVTIRHVPGGIVSATYAGVTATGMTEEVALRELVRKVEKMGARPAK